MQKHKASAGLLLLLTGIFLIVLGMGVTSQTLCLNETFVPNTDNGLTVANTAASPFIEFNLTGSGRLEAYSYSGSGGAWTTYQWNGSLWSTNATLSTGLPINPAGAGNRMSLSMAYNITGNTSSEVAVANVVNSSLRFYFWNGSTWIDSNLGFINGSIGSNTNAHTTICKSLGAPRGAAVITINDADVNLAYEYIGGNWTRNDSLIPDSTGMGGILGLDCVFNLTGHNLTNLYRVTGSGSAVVYYYNNSNWTNITVSGKQVEAANGKAHFVRQYFNGSFVTTQGVTGPGVYLNMTNYTANFSIPVFSTIQTNISKISIGDVISTNVTFFNTCGVKNAYFQLDNGSGYTNLTQYNLVQTLKNATVSFNITGTSLCNQSYSIRYMALGSGNISAESAVATIKTTPEIITSNASANNYINISCISRTNFTFRSNITDFINITFNLSQVFFGSNATCFFKVNNTNRLLATNSSNSCIVELVGVNLTAGAVIGVFFDSGFSPGRPGNLGLAIAVGTISAIVVAYSIAVRRRTSS